MGKGPKDIATGLPLSAEQIARRKAESQAAHDAMVASHGGEQAYAEVQAQERQGSKVLFGAFVFISILIAGVWYGCSSNTRSGSEDGGQDSSRPKSLAAKTACMNAVRAQARFPGKADFSLFSIGATQTHNGWEVAGKVELMNGLGLMVPHKFYCRTRSNTVITVDTFPG